jgi:hypothetical protein
MMPKRKVFIYQYPRGNLRLTIDMVVKISDIAMNIADMAEFH